MLKLIRHHLILAITLLAMLSQGVGASGLLMVDASHLGSHSRVNDTLQLSQTTPTTAESASPDCHSMQQAISTVTQDDCCDSDPQQAVKHQAGCCDGENGCQANCSHCVVISLTASLVNQTAWPKSFVPEAALATPMPHFHSISINQQLRPPRA